jgi:hypothetical protein
MSCFPTKANRVLRRETDMCMISSSTQVWSAGYAICPDPKSWACQTMAATAQRRGLGRGVMLHFCAAPAEQWPSQWLRWPEWRRWTRDRSVASLAPPGHPAGVVLPLLDAQVAIKSLHRPVEASLPTYVLFSTKRISVFFCPLVVKTTVDLVTRTSIYSPPQSGAVVDRKTRLNLLVAQIKVPKPLFLCATQQSGPPNRDPCPHSILMVSSTCCSAGSHIATE